MMSTRPVLLAVLCLGMSGCWFRKNTQPKIPAPVPAAQPVTTQPTPAQPVTPQPVTTPNAPQAPPKPAVRRNPVPAPPTPVAPVAPPPPLREILSGEQRRQYETEFSQGVVRAGAVLKQTSTRTLSASQQETAARIRTFLAQANAMRDDDISTALQLVRRADLLGQELLKSLK